MRKIRLIVGYDGTAFHGWQVQPGRRTAQGVLEEELARVLGQPVGLTAAGRTDAGCHARGQVVSFETSSRLPVHAFAPALRERLPVDLQVRSAEETTPRFDARRSAQARRYAYRLLDAPDVLLGRIAWYPRLRIDPEALQRTMAPLEGEHDCSALESRGSTPRRKVCRIYRAAWRRWEGGLLLDVIADHFLYRMVRTLVGTALQHMGDADPGASMAGVLDSRDRARAGPTAPPHGLCLEQVFYAGVTS